MKSKEPGMQRSARCSGCSGEFSWSVSATQPSNLFPLLCGDIFCRSCLAQEARRILSTRLAPLRCCEKVVPHDFVLEVLEHEEDVYYSYLLNLPCSDHRVGDAPTAQKLNAKDVPELPSRIGTVSTVDTETLRNEGTDVRTSIGTSLQDHSDDRQVAIATYMPRLLDSILDIPSIQPPQTRYFTRSSKTRFVVEQDPKQNGSTTDANEQPSVASPARKYCQMCGIRRGFPRFKAPCGHELCRKCVETSARKYLDTNPNDNVVPAGCCGKLLPLDLVQRVMSGQELETYVKRMVSTATDNIIPTRGSKRKTAPQNKSILTERTTKGSKGKAPAKKVKREVNQNQDTERVCISCYIQISSPGKWRVVPCGHGYCVSCLKKMVKASLTDRSQIPVRCCSTEFPMEYVEQTLTSAQFQQYKSFLAERNPNTSTLQSDRDYAAVVRNTNGKQCPICGIGVVKISGCNAITCPLGHYFCWKCLNERCTCGMIYKYN